MTSWLERARALFQVTADGEPDKTDKSLLSSVLSVSSSQENKTKEQIFSVLTAQDKAIFECSDRFEELMAAAMHCCDVHNDGPLAREQMREEVTATPLELWADLLVHFNEAYGGMR